MKPSNTIVHRTIEGDFIAAFDSSTSAAEATGLHYSTVRRVVTGVRGSKRFSFRQQNRAAMHNATRGKMRITQRQDDVVVAVYADLDTAARMTGITVGAIRKVLNQSGVLDGSTFNG